MNRLSKAPGLVTSPLSNEGTLELQEQIRRRAYELYEQRGREDGRQLDDWLQAESELTQSRERAVAA